MRLGAVYNQMFISPLMFDNKKVNNNNYNGGNNDNSDDSVNINKIVDTPSNFVITLDDSGETISGTYNAGDFKILTPNEYVGMFYGEIKETNTKFIIQKDSTVVYGQNFSDYEVYLTLPGARGLFVGYKNIDFTQQFYQNYIVWAYATILSYQLSNSTSLQTVLLSEYTGHDGYNGDVFTYTSFGNAPNLTTVTLSDNNSYTEDDHAFRNCPNIKDVRIILYKKDIPNTKNIEIIKNSFPSPKPTFTLYNPL